MARTLRPLQEQVSTSLFRIGCETARVTPNLFSLIFLGLSCLAVSRSKQESPIALRVLQIQRAADRIKLISPLYQPMRRL